VKFYTCESCGFVFTRTGEWEICPDCNKKTVRIATDEEVAKVTEKLTTTSKGEANN